MHLLYKKKEKAASLAEKITVKPVIDPLTYKMRKGFFIDDM